MAVFYNATSPMYFIFMRVPPTSVHIMNRRKKKKKTKIFIHRVVFIMNALNHAFTG